MKKKAEAEGDGEEVTTTHPVGSHLINRLRKKRASLVQSSPASVMSVRTEGKRRKKGFDPFEEAEL